MKTKSKLLAGGLMTVISCALAGSITGTFAWYQISNRSTVSMHGASIGSSQNLQLCLGDPSIEANWTSENLHWEQIKAAAAFKGIDSTEANGLKDQLYPASNGANTGSAALNATWYTNPNGGIQLPEVPKTTGDSPKYQDGYFVQFTFYARYQEYTNGTPSYPAAYIYVDQIASKLVENREKDVTFALRMHVKMGDSTYFVVNPYETSGKTVTLSSEYEEVAAQYDWSPDNPTKTTVKLPVEGDTVGTLVTLDHAAVVQEFNDDGSIKDTDQVSKYVTTTADSSTGVAITVTFWLEGFAEAPAVADNPETTDVDESKAASDWWEAGTTIGDSLDFGFELRGVKA